MSPVTMTAMARPEHPDALKVHPQDDVLVALRDLQPGEAV